MADNEFNQTSESPPTQQKGPDVSSTLTEPQLQISPNVSDIPPTPKIKSPKILLLGLVLLLAIIAGGGYFFLQNQKQKSATEVSIPNDIQKAPTSTPVQIPGWEKYIVHEYNFEFLYPESLEINDYKRNGYRTIEFGTMGLYKGNYDMDGYAISINIYPKNLMSEGYKRLNNYNKEDECKNDTFKMCSDIGESHIAEIKSKTINILNTPNSRISSINEYYFEKEDTLFVITKVSSYINENDEKDNDVLTIFNSFRFTDKQTSTMKTFVDNEFNITFSHPDYWNVNSGMGGGEGEEPWWQVNIIKDRYFFTEITRDNNPNDLTPEEWFDEKEKSRWNKYIEKIATPTIDGKLSLIMALPDTCKTAPWFVVFIQNKDYMYTLTYFNDNKSIRAEELEIILKDFHFTEEGNNGNKPNSIPDLKIPPAPTDIDCDN